MPKEAIIALVSTLSGLLFANLLTLFQTYIFRKADDNRYKNIIIHNLLEMRFYLMQYYRSDKLIRIFIDKILKIDKQVFRENTIYINQISKLILDQNININNDIIIKNFNDAMIKFSSIDPLSAFQISHHNDAFELTKKIDEYFDRFFELSKSASDEMNDSLLYELANDSKKVILMERIKDIEKAILKNQRGFLFNKKIRYYLYLSKTSIESDKVLLKDFNLLIKKHFPDIFKYFE